MRFARIVFTVAGMYGIVVLFPPLFLESKLGRDYPPPVTHPEFFYGFFALGIAWQILFLILGTDPIKYRTMMIPSMLEKLSYIGTCFVLHAQGRISFADAATAFPDIIFLALFLTAFFKTAPGNVGGSSRVWIPNVRIP